MWHVLTEPVISGHKYRLFDDESPLSFADLFRLLEHNDEFSAWYSNLLSGSEFDAFYWELPPLTSETMANATEFGLTAGVYTNDLRTAMNMARDLESGLVWINGGGRHFLGTGFSGWKNSGLGREECLEELLSYTQSKAVHIIL